MCSSIARESNIDTCALSCLQLNISEAEDEDGPSAPADPSSERRAS